LSFTRIKQTKEDKEKTLELNKRLQGISDEYRAIGYEYKLSDVEKRELLFEKYKRKFPETYVYDIQRIYRIKVPVTDRHSKQEQERYREYYTYVILEEVTDNAGGVHENPRHHQGWHPSPIGKFKYNEFEEPVDSDINNWKITYELPWYPNEVRKLADGSRSQVGQLRVGLGVTIGRQGIIQNNPYTIYNFNEFMNGDFDDLLSMGQMGLSRTEPGGLAEVRDMRLRRQQDSEKDIVEQQARVGKK
jgi:hypothetical protein